MAVPLTAAVPETWPTQRQQGPELAWWDAPRLQHKKMPIPRAMLGPKLLGGSVSPGSSSPAAVAFDCSCTPPAGGTSGGQQQDAEQNLTMTGGEAERHAIAWRILRSLAIDAPRSALSASAARRELELSMAAIQLARAHSDETPGATPARLAELLAKRDADLAELLVTPAGDCLAPFSDDCDGEGSVELGRQFWLLPALDARPCHPRYDAQIADELPQAKRSKPASSSPERSASSTHSDSNAAPVQPRKQPHHRHDQEGSSTAAGQTHQTIAKRKTLPLAVRQLMTQWLLDHFENPYPSEEERRYFASLADASDTKVQTFFTNARARVWKPFVEGLPGYRVVTDAAGKLSAQKDDDA
jgi:hypothetical protein